MARETNDELVVRLMNYGPAGALSQLFIIEAIRRYAEEVAEAPPMEMSFISGESWKAAALHIRSELNKHLGM